MVKGGRSYDPKPCSWGDPSCINQPSSVAVVIKVNVALLHESLMIVACRNEMCDHESDGENKEQETTHDKHLSDDVSKPRARQFSNNLHT